MRCLSDYAHCGRGLSAHLGWRPGQLSPNTPSSRFQAKKCDIWWYTPLATTRSRWLGTLRGGSFSLMWSAALSALTVTRRASNRKMLYCLLNILGCILTFDSLMRWDSLSLTACFALNHIILWITSHCCMKLIMEHIWWRRLLSRKADKQFHIFSKIKNWLNFEEIVTDGFVLLYYFLFQIKIPYCGYNIVVIPLWCQKTAD